MRRRTSFDEQIGKRCQHVLVVELARDDQRQAFPAGFVDDGQDPELAPVVGASFDEVVCPDMPRILWPQPDAGAVVQPQPTALWLLLRHLQALEPPDPLHALVV